MCSSDLKLSNIIMSSSTPKEWSKSSTVLDIIGRPEGVALPDMIKEVQAQAGEKMLQVKKMNNSRRIAIDLQICCKYTAFF